MASYFMDAALMDYNDLIGFLNGRKPVSDRNCGSALHKLFQGFLNESLGFGYEQFDIDESNHIVNACPMHHAPTDSKFKKQVYRAHFSKKLCTNCPHRPHCPVSEQKKQFLFEVSETKLHCSMLRAEMGTAEYKEIASKRAGVEGIPSILRRKHDVDHLPVRGRVRSKVWFGFKIDAINTKRFIKSRIETTKSALASLVNNNLLEVLCFQRTFLLRQAA